MAYRFKTGESISDEIKRIVTEEIDSATEILGTKGKKDRDGAVHEARKSIKKIRGVLRLLRPELGRAYKDENNRLREVANQLSDIRDAAALIEVFDQVIEAHGPVIDKKSVAAIRKGLQRDKAELEGKLKVDDVIGRASAALQSARKRVSGWPVGNSGFKVLAPGLKLTYRNGRKALKKAEKRQTSENFHDLRKRVKDHWYQIRLLESAWTEVMQAREASLKDLETWLGDDHNLFVLCGKLQNQPERYGGVEGIQFFLALGSQQQEELRDKSLSLAVRIYEGKASVFVESTSRLWNAWNDQPHSMKESQKEVRDSPPKQVAKPKAKKSKTAA